MKRAVLLLALVLVAAFVLLRGGDGTTYMVRPGDTLAEIAMRHGTTVETLVAMNRDRYPSLAERPDRIEVGWVLRVPGEGEGVALADVREKAGEVVAYVDALAMTATAEEPTPTPTPEPYVGPAQVDAWRKEVIRLANVERAKVGAPPLVEDPRLNEIAEARVRDMVERGYYSHYDPETGEALAHKLCGLSCSEIANLFSPSYKATPSNAINAWMNSPKHREALQNPGYQRVGAAIAVGTIRYNGRTYRAAVMVMIFQ